MNRIIRSMSYAFHRNLGTRDRIVRAAISLCAIGSWYFGALVGITGLIITVIGLMVLGTSISSRCAIMYLKGINTMSQKDRNRLDNMGIAYEK